ncbi:MAG TPA: hypothetical protein VK911_05385 [Vicinamibacterales bacterium]|nr:hypothetical protein [Vicinamibacterales bacterium]
MARRASVLLWTVLLPVTLQAGRADMAVPARPHAMCARTFGQTSLRSYRLARIEFVGLQRVPRARVLALTRLQPDTLVTQRDVEAAAARLLDSLLFSSVSHRYRMAGYSLIVTFVLEESSWTTTFVFDNFIGYTDERLTDAVAASLPLFEGRTADSPAMLGRIATALQVLVRGDQPAATVSYVFVSESRAGPRHYRFTLDVPGRRTPVCGIELAGLPEDQVTEARKKARPLTGTNYSRDFIHQHAVQNILPVCHKDGRYLARVTGLSSPRLLSTAACPDGVEVTIHIDPGARYTWSAIAWSGVTGPTAEALSRDLGIAPGEAADIGRLDDRLTALTTAYHDRGYLAARLLPHSAVDEAARTVACRVNVIEGTRYRFKGLEVTGLEPDLASRICGRWTLATGEFYDGAYTRRFLAEIREAERAALAGRTTITVRERPDATTGTVDLVLEFPERR